jgi:hypothetical protein
MSGSSAVGSLPRRRRGGREFDTSEETTMQIKTNVKSGKLSANRCESIVRN